MSDPVPTCSTLIADAAQGDAAARQAFAAARDALTRLRTIAAEDGLTVVLSLRDATLSDAVGDQALYLADGRLRDVRSATAAGRRQALSARTRASASSSSSACSA